MDKTREGTVARVSDGAAIVRFDGGGEAECESLVGCSVGDRVAVGLRGSKPTEMEGGE